MATTVTINSITSGLTPYDIWVCDYCDGTCQFITTITNGDLPYSFTLPSIYETYPNYVIKLIDDNGCTYCQENVIYKQFQDSTFFDFMDGNPFEFQ